jgi:hypothetical protein
LLFVAGAEPQYFIANVNMFVLAYLFLTSLAGFKLVNSQKIVVVNDDGWAVAQIRAEYEELTEAGYDVRSCMDSMRRNTKVTVVF